MEDAILQATAMITGLPGAKKLMKKTWINHQMLSHSHNSGSISYSSW
jgi:hypothetical protein